MAEPIITLEAAITKVKSKCAYNQTPALTPDEVQECVEDNVLIEIWEPEHSYKIGDVVAPTEDNQMGRVMRCVTGGVSGTEEPDWTPIADRASAVINGSYVGNVGSGQIAVYDNGVRWVDNGPETDHWDIGQAISDAWLKKAQKAADIPTFSRGGNTYDTNAIYRNCIDQSNRYGGAFIK
jgi:hypothetical protein